MALRCLAWMRLRRESDILGMKLSTAPGLGSTTEAVAIPDRTHSSDRSNFGGWSYPPQLLKNISAIRPHPTINEKTTPSTSAVHPWPLMRASVNIQAATMNRTASVRRPNSASASAMVAMWRRCMELVEPCGGGQSGRAGYASA